MKKFIEEIPVREPMRTFGATPIAVFTYGLASPSGLTICGNYEKVSANLFGALVSVMESVMSKEFMQRRFEVWIDSLGLDTDIESNGEYSSYVVQGKWESWQAALSNIQSVPELIATESDIEAAVKQGVLK